MPIVVPEQEFQQLVELIVQYPEGIGVDELVQKLGSSIPKRTLQRRLAALAIRFGLHPLEFAAWHEKQGR